jgi:hypothetical protein
MIGTRGPYNLGGFATTCPKVVKFQEQGLCELIDFLSSLFVVVLQSNTIMVIGTLGAE